jgi:PAS domain S-box-containing protein
MSVRPSPSGHEVFLKEDEIIVSKTDLRGIVTYANDVFLKIAGYTEAEVLGRAHNFIRHPKMPRCVFKLLWDTIAQEQEIFAYVLNMAKNGDEYWVFAHVTPSYDNSGKHIGYHSSRRAPYPDALAKVKPLYAQLLETEARYTDPKAAMEASTQQLLTLLSQAGVDYSQFVFSLSADTSLDSY